MTVDEIMKRLAANGSESIKKILLKHGVKEPFFGVKVEELKKIQKIVQTDYRLAMGLYATGNADAMYLAGLITDDEKMTMPDLQQWVQHAYSNNISEYTVPWVAAQGKHGYALALEWIKSEEPHIAAAGWNTLSCVMALQPDAALDIVQINNLLQQVQKQIHSAENRVRHCMNGFVMSTGVYVTGLTEKAIAMAKKIGPVTVYQNGTACQTPSAEAYIQKCKDKGVIGKKKKKVKC